MVDYNDLENSDSLDEQNTQSLLTTILQKKDILFGLVFSSILTIIIYSLFFVFGNLLGESPLFSSLLLGERPNTMIGHGIWQIIIRSVIFIFPQSLKTIPIFYSSIVGFFFAILLMYYCVLMFFRIIIYHTSAGLSIADEKSIFVKDNYVRICAVLASCLFAFSPQCVVQSSRVGVDFFYLNLLLLAIFLNFLFIVKRKPLYMYLSGLIIGLLFTQTALVIFLFIPLLFLIVYTLFYVSMMRFKTLFFVLVSIAIGATLGIFASFVNYLNTEGYVLQNITEDNQLVKLLLSGLLLDIRNVLPHSGWLIILGFVYIPFFSMLLSCRYSMYAENYSGFNFFHLIMLIITSVTILPTGVTLWDIFGVTSYTLFGMMLVSVAFSYAILYFIVRSVYISQKIDFSKVQELLKSFCRWGIVVIGYTVLLISVFSNDKKNEVHSNRALKLFVNQILDSMNGRTWLITSSSMADMVRVCSNIRKMDINVIALDSGMSSVEQNYLKTKFDSAQLKNSIDIGLMQFLRDWLTTEQDIDKKLATLVWLDLWLFGNYEPYPNGIVFFGAKKKELNACVSQYDYAKEFDESYTKVEKLLNKLPDNNSANSIVSSVKRYYSFVINNAGFAEESINKHDDALALYDRACVVDDSNISARLNYLSLLYQKADVANREKLDKQIKDFLKNHERGMDIWTLSRTHGYVSHPEFFADLGLSWALSGFSDIAQKNFSRAHDIASMDGIDTFGLQLASAGIKTFVGDDAGASMDFENLYKMRPNDIVVLMNLIHYAVLEGRYTDADRYIKEAEANGLSKDVLLREQATLYISKGDTNKAREVLDQLDSNSNKTADVLFLYFISYINDFKVAVDEKDKNLCLEKMERYIGKLVALREDAAFQTTMAQGYMEYNLGKYERARNFFKNALTYSTGHLPIMELLLKCDYFLGDLEKARRDAAAILRINKNHGFANYILGSISAKKEEYASAEVYLKTSLEGGASFLTLSDLSYVLYKNGNYKEAREYCNKALAINESFYEVWDTMGLIYFALNKNKDAIDAFSKSISLSDGDKRVHIHLASVLYEDKNIDAVKTILKEIEEFEHLIYGEELKQYLDLWEKVFEEKKR